MNWPKWASPLLLAVILTGLNASKSAHVDDYWFLTYAREFAAHPSRPYDFAFGSPIARPANETLATPPVLPAWLALGMSLLKDNTVVLKLWLFPFAWLLAGAVAMLLRRFAPTVSEPLTWLTVLSPGILPSFNFMLEIPVLSLQLTALALTIKACDRGQWSWLLAAGLIAGLALQTKYTAFAALGAMVLWCLQAKRPFFAVVIFLLSCGAFVGWETFVLFRQGDAHFLNHLGHQTGSFLPRIAHLVLPLVANLGGLMPAVALLGLAALQWSDRRLTVMAVSIVAGFLALAIVPDEWAIWEYQGKRFYTLFQSLYGLLGALICVVVVAVIGRLNGVPFRRAGDRVSTLNADLFLVLWLAGEIAWYLVISPFPAVRRVLGISIVATLLIARLADRTCSTGLRRRWVWGSALGGVALGLVFFAVDWQEARAAQQAATIAARGEYQPEAGGAAWFLDQHGFGFSCQREGLRPLALNRIPPRRGDVIFVCDHPFDMKESIKADQNPHLRKIGTISVTDGWPLRTYANFYAGSAPLRHLEGPRYVAAVYRVSKDFYVPASAP